jgi:hypothetical protein
MIDDPNKPKSGIRGLLDYAKKVNENTGLSRAESFAAALDPLIMKDMRAGDSIRAAGERRVAAGNKNKTMQMLIDSGQQDLADAVASGAVPIASAVNLMFQRQNQAKQRGFDQDDATLAFERQKILKGMANNSTKSAFAVKYAAYKAAYPNLSEPELLQKLEGDKEFSTAYNSLKERAKVGGIEVGTQRYENFILSNGKSEETLLKADASNLAQYKKDFNSTASLLGPQLENIDKLLADPYLDKMLGPRKGLYKNISGPANRVQAMLDQLSGTAFLAARQELRSGGQITDYEGNRAEAALSRLKNVKMGSQAYRQAIKDFRKILTGAYQRNKLLSEGREIPASLSGLDPELTGENAKPKIGWSRVNDN